LLLYRREDLAERWPEELAALNTDVEEVGGEPACRSLARIHAHA
jgi:hypothetical protein